MPVALEKLVKKHSVPKGKKNDESDASTSAPSVDLASNVGA